MVLISVSSIYGTFHAKRYISCNVTFPGLLPLSIPIVATAQYYHWQHKHQMQIFTSLIMFFVFCFIVWEMSKVCYYTGFCVNLKRWVVDVEYMKTLIIPSNKWSEQLTTVWISGAVWFSTKWNMSCWKEKFRTKFSKFNEMKETKFSKV